MRLVEPNTKFGSGPFRVNEGLDQIFLLSSHDDDELSFGSANKQKGSSKSLHEVRISVRSSASL
jgi:hypothetical protein